MGLIILFIVIIMGILAVIPAKIAGDKGREFGTWYVYGFFLWLIAVIHASCLSDDTAKQESSPTIENIIKPEVGDMHAIDIKCPITVNEIEIAKTEQGDCSLKLNFKTFASKRVKAIKLKVVGYNLLNERISVNNEESFEIVIQDIRYNREGTNFYNAHYIPLPSNEIRNIDLSIMQIAYEDGEIVNKIEHELIDIEMEEITPYEKKVVAKELVSTAIYFPKEEERFWICTCGAPNNPDNKECMKCGISKTELFEKLSNNNLEKQYNLYLKQEAERRDKLDARRVKRNIVIVIASIAIFGIIAYTISSATL